MSYFAAVFRDQAKYSFKRKITGVLLIVLMIIMCTVSCTQTRKPAEVLSEKEMVKVLVEIYLVEEKAGKLDIGRDSIQKIFPKFREKVFEKVKISDSTFIRSMDYYMANPEMLEHIYAAVVDSLSFRAQAISILDSAARKDELPK